MFCIGKVSVGEEERETEDRFPERERLRSCGTRLSGSWMDQAHSMVTVCPGYTGISAVATATEVELEP